MDRRPRRPRLPGRADAAAARLRRAPVAAVPGRSACREQVGHAVYLKREDLTHTGAHKINNALGQALLAKRMGKTRIIAETGAGSTASRPPPRARCSAWSASSTWAPRTCAARRPTCSAWSCSARRVVPGRRGRAHAQGGVNEAIRDWVANVADTHYVIGSGVGPAPFPALVRDLQRSSATRRARRSSSRPARLPDRVIACVGGGSNAIGTFCAFLGDAGVATHRRGGGGGGHRHRPARRAADRGGRGGVLHGAYTCVMQDEDGQILEAHSISRRPGLSRRRARARLAARHAAARGTSRVTDDEALEAFQRLRRARGHHPGARVRPRARLGARRGRAAGERGDGRLVCLSGRGDKDLAEALDKLGGLRRSTLSDRRSRPPPSRRRSPRARARGADALPDGRLPGHRDLGPRSATAYADGGADLVELGVPFSDPLADGPVIHAAAHRRARRRAPTCTRCSRPARRIAELRPGRAHVLRQPDLARGPSASPPMPRSAASAG